MLRDDSTAAQTFELYGPKNYSTAEIAELVDREIFKKRRHMNVPKAILKPVAGLLNRVLWWPIMSADEVEREFHDQFIDETAKTFKDLGITPGDIKDFTYHYLVSLTAHNDLLIFSLPCSKGTEALRTMTCHQPRRRREGKKRSIFTCWMTSESGLATIA